MTKVNKMDDWMVRANQVNERNWTYEHKSAQSQAGRSDSNATKQQPARNDVGQNKHSDSNINTSMSY